MEFKMEDYKLLTEIPGTALYKKRKARAQKAGAFISDGDLEYINHLVLLNYLSKQKAARVEKREEAKKARPLTGNPYNRIKSLGKLMQTEKAIRKAIDPRDAAIQALFAELDSETDIDKRSKISSRLGKKLADKAKSESMLEQIAKRRTEIEKEINSRVEQGRKAKSKSSDSPEGKLTTK